MATMVVFWVAFKLAAIRISTNDVTMTTMMKMTMLIGLLTIVMKMNHQKKKKERNTNPIVVQKHAFLVSFTFCCLCSSNVR